MGTALISYLRDIWPFSYLNVDDLKLSDKLVRRLALPESTKQFIFAVREPTNDSTVYILCAQNLSERSAKDAELLIREVRPDEVVALVPGNKLSDIHQLELLEGVDDLVPTSAFGVMKRCFINKTDKNEFELLAGDLVLKEIFGVGFYSHFFVAKQLAKDIGSSFSVLDSPFIMGHDDEIDPSPETSTSSHNKLPTLGLQSTSLVSKNFGPVISHSRRFLIANDVQSQMIKLVCPTLASSLAKVNPSGSSVDAESDIIDSRCNYCAPSFAQSVYPLLLDLHDMFPDIPSMGRALTYAQKMFLDVGKGDDIKSDILSEVHTFQIAIEGLRIALNNAGRLPLHKSGNININFHDLSAEEKSHCLLAQALQSRAKKFKKVVAVVDAKGFAGLRKFWNTPIPEEFQDILEELALSKGFDPEISDDGEKKWRLSAKPVVAVGAGASAVLGASSLSKVVPFPTIVKIVTMNVPTSLKIFLTQTHKVTAFLLTKILGPSKVMAPGVKMSTSIFKAGASAGKARTVIYGAISSAEKTSFNVMRTSFYEIMRNRRVKPIGAMPWATFGLSVATCGGLVMCEDRIGCAVESLPEAPSIACMGRGIHNLQRTSVAVRQSCGHKIQTAIELLMYRFKNGKIK